jgi:NAD(P)-dependent dehydrogenase (short-subunit alcohol dehydrogenase family)
MDMSLREHVAVIVGGARGLGLAIAQEFSAEGTQVVLVDRESEVETIAHGISPDALGFPGDVTDYAAMQTMANTVRTRFGRCDHLVFAAGVGSGQFGFPFWKVDPSSWEHVLRVNLVGGVNVAHAFAPAMAEARTGTILFIASVAGQMGSQTDPPYSASKAGLINFAQCAAKDLAPHGVRVNVLNPGMVQTVLNRSVYESWADRQPVENRPTYEQWAGEKVRTIVPLQRWQTPKDVASMSVFLASSRAHNVTGQCINVDGGYVMHC